MFSVLIPVYNHALHLNSAVGSALVSPLVDEVLLVDDGSSDDSSALIESIARRYPQRVRQLNNPGAINRGAACRLNQRVFVKCCV